MQTANPSDLVDRHREKTFVEKVLEYSIKKDMSSKAIYKAAQIDRKLFSKIMCDNEYRPARDTCMALAYALKLDYGEASDLISRAGYTFSESSRRDILLEYFFRKQKYDLDLINGVLYELNEKTLGSGRF